MLFRIVYVVYFFASFRVTKETGLEGIQMCDLDNPCPNGYSCHYSSSIVGLQVCQRDFGGNFQLDQAAKKPGRCPPSTATGGSNRVARQARPFGLGWGCNTHPDCPNDLRCCPTQAGYSACSEPLQLGSDPQVTVIIEGTINAQNLNPITVDLIGTVTLVQSKGFNVLVDTGNARRKVPLLQALHDKGGLNPEDIHYIITTHGHPDHYSNGDLFSNVPNNFDKYVVNGTIFTTNALYDNQTYFINNDRNLELRETPGHTPQCTSLIVRNVTRLGTVAIVGDLFLTRNDYNQPEVLQQFSYDSQVYDRNRRRIACSVDWIVPGHGAMFQMDNSLRTVFGC